MALLLYVVLLALKSFGAVNPEYRERR